MIAPHYEKLSEEHENWIFLKIDVDSEETQAITAECGIRAMPTFKFFNGDGAMIDELVGASVDKLVSGDSSARCAIPPCSVWYASIPRTRSPPLDFECLPQTQTCYCCTLGNLA